MIHLKDIAMMDIDPDKFWEANSKDSLNLLKHFADKELQAELDRRQGERRKLEMLKIVGDRDPVGFFDMATGTDGQGEHREFHAEWELHIIFSDATKHRFTFSSKVGQTAKDMDDFRMLYFPHLTRLDHIDYERMVAAAKKKRRNHKKICHRPS